MKKVLNSDLILVMTMVCMSPSPGQSYGFQNPNVLHTMKYACCFCCHESSYELGILMGELEGEWHDLEGLWVSIENRRGREGIGREEIEKGNEEGRKKAKMQLAARKSN
jgi:hypothetical protein